MSRLIFALLLLLGATRAVAQVPDIQIEQPAGSTIPDGTGQVLFGSVSVGSEVLKTFTIRNTGTATLTGFGITKTGTNPNDYITSGPGVSSVNPTGTTTFSVTFRPGAVGQKTATIHVTSSDPNENPYDINLTGQATPVGVPDIAVFAGAGSLTDGVSTVNFGNIALGSSSRRTITVRNSGTGTLSGLSAIVSGGDFQGEAIPITSLAAGADTDFDITFTPSGEFESSGSLTIASNDADENPFNLTLRGTGVVPLMDVEQPAGTRLIDGSSIVDFGTTDPGAPVELTFTLRNVSNGALTGLALTKDGANPGDYALGSLPSTLAMGASATFTVGFNPSAAGDRTAVLHIASNQGGAETFDINLKGVGTSLSDFGDADSDGSENLLEQATANDPLTAGPPPGTIAMNGTNLEFTFTKSVAYLFQVYYDVEWSDDLTVWNGVPGENSVIVSDDGIVQVVKVTYPAGANGKRYLRLRVYRV